MSQLDLLQLLGGTLAKGALLLLARGLRRAPSPAAVRRRPLRGLDRRVRRAAAAAGAQRRAASLGLRGSARVLPIRCRRARDGHGAGAWPKQRHRRAMVRAMAGHATATWTCRCPTASSSRRRKRMARAARAAAPWLLGVWLAGALVVLARLVARRPPDRPRHPAGGDAPPGAAAPARPWRSPRSSA